jgi:putative transposase
MIDRTHELPLVQQCQILELAGSTAYYQPVPISPEDLALMRRIDELHLEMPYAGARVLSRMPKRESKPVGRRRVSTLMQHMDIHALYRKPNIRRRHPAHKVYPYLLRNLSITLSNHEWAADITYIPMKRGFVYLFAVIDWASRRVLSWRLSNTLTTDFCIEAVQETINRYGRQEIFNTNQGCPFTSLDFTGLLKDNNIQISMDGKGCWRDNAFVGRLWRSVKYEEVNLHAYDNVSAAKSGLQRYFARYNLFRPHSSLDDKTPDEFYFDNQPTLKKAA